MLSDVACGLKKREMIVSVCGQAPVCGAMELQHILVASSAVQAVHILRHQRT